MFLNVYISVIVLGLYTDRNELKRMNDFQSLFLEPFNRVGSLMISNFAI